MKNNFLIVLGVVLIIILALIIIYPSIEFYIGDNLYLMTYGKDWDKSEDLDELEQELCYDESYSYNVKRDISISGWEYEGFLFFKWFKVKYKEGNVCATEYLLEESYIKKFLEKAKIESNEENVDLAKLIENKTAVVGNTRYNWDETAKYIGYTLDGKYMDMYIWINEEGFVIVQVGLSDEGPKYIAYK